MMKNKHISQKEISIAKSVSLIDYLQSEHPDLIVYDGKTHKYIHPEHDSLKYSEAGFYRFSDDTCGDQIQFLQDWLGFENFQAAVIELCHFSGLHGSDTVIRAEVNYTYEIPEKNQDYKRVIAYLTKTRGIPADTVQELIQAGALYEDLQHNCVFFYEDKNGRTIAVQKGTLTEKRFNRINSSHHNNYWAWNTGSTETVYICESPIDAISFRELNNRKPGVYASMNGLKNEVFNRIKADYPGSNIVLCVDWDKAGIEFRTKYKGITKLQPKEAERELCKDWNELLQFRKSKK